MVSSYNLSVHILSMNLSYSQTHLLGLFRSCGLMCVCVCVYIYLYLQMVLTLTIGLGRIVVSTTLNPIDIIFVLNYVIDPCMGM